MSSAKKFLLVLICLVGSVAAWGQAARTPFSSFGIGEPYGNALIHNQGMGGVGLAHPQFWFLNNQNPALLVYNGLTVFEAGIVLERRTLRGDTTSERSDNGNMNYLATAFPIKPGKWSTSIGLMPYTTVNYKVIDTEGDVIGSDETVTEIEEGSGGLTQLYWSNGVRLNSEFSIGLKATYIFGSITKTYSNQLNIQDQSAVFLVPVEDKTFMKDFSFTAGLSYSKDSIGSNHQYRVSLGGIYGFSTKLNAERTLKLQRTDAVGNIYESLELDSINGHVQLPATFGFGASFSKGSKWMLGIDYYYSNWNKYSSVSQEGEGLEASSKIAIGGEFTPDVVSVDNYLKRINYRLGLSYEKYPFLANNKAVTDFGINFGFSLPAGRSSLDFAFKLGKRGNKAENILEENYFKVYFGITFNDQWFIKRKFD
ncbi:MAG: hypothetical protein HC859_11890 [Bacteroidia bacterium]|nr:hypothetical protein [Bacteroidia bacterium]